MTETSHSFNQVRPILLAFTIDIGKTQSNGFYDLSIDSNEMDGTSTDVTFLYTCIIARRINWTG